MVVNWIFKLSGMPLNDISPDSYRDQFLDLIDTYKTFMVQEEMSFFFKAQNGNISSKTTHKQYG